MTDVLFNLILASIDALVLWYVARSRDTAPAVLAAGVGLLTALGVSVFAHEGTFHLLRLHGYVAFAHVPAVLAGTAWILRVRHRPLSWSALGSAVLIWGVATQAFLIEPFRLEVTTVTLESERVTRPLRIAVVADFQADEIGGYERRALQTVLDAGPDLVLMPGDYLHENGPRREQLGKEFAALLNELDFGAPLGAFAVRGNVEHDDWPELFTGSRVTPLPETTTIRVGEAEITGLGLWASFDPRLRVGRSSGLRIVFGHAPDFALGQVDADLMIAGHTHGGQVRLPLIGPLITFSQVPRRWAAGTTRLSGGRTLVVSRGIGMERGRAPRVRFLCRPEIVLIDVVPPRSGG